jgi:hypothetical protein
MRKSSYNVVKTHSFYAAPGLENGSAPSVAPRPFFWQNLKKNYGFCCGSDSSKENYAAPAL